MEPIYIAQTHEPENCATRAARQSWFKGCIEDARKRGAQSMRATISKEGYGLLFEAWKERVVKDQGEPRWTFAAHEKGEG